MSLNKKKSPSKIQILKSSNPCLGRKFRVQVPFTQLILLSCASVWPAEARLTILKRNCSFWLCYEMVSCASVWPAEAQLSHFAFKAFGWLNKCNYLGSMLGSHLFSTSAKCKTSDGCLGNLLRRLFPRLLIGASCERVRAIFTCLIITVILDKEGFGGFHVGSSEGR